MAEVSRKTDGKEGEEEGVKVDRKMYRKARGRVQTYQVRKLGSWEVGKSGSQEGR